MCLLSQRRKRAKGQAGCVDCFLEVPLLDKSNCRECGEPTCMAFAACVHKVVR
ncbi:MAG: hypothetical protein JRD04_08345 [Deltaproteobacteria bacterium]|nr:hypothetical protein [Deltaproteobacteria bacterium]